MKDFAQDKKNADTIDNQNQKNDSNKYGQYSPKDISTNPMGMGTLLEGAQAGDMAAFNTMQYVMGNSIATKPQLLGQFNPEISSKIYRSTGFDISDATVEVDPSLDQEGKQGAAEAGQRIYISPACKNQEKTLCHEGIHIVQGRGGSSAKNEDSKRSEDRDVEKEAIDGAEAVLAGQEFMVMCQVGGEKLYEDVDGDSRSCDLTRKKLISIVSKLPDPHPARIIPYIEKIHEEVALKALLETVQYYTGESGFHLVAALPAIISEAQRGALRKKGERE